MQWNFDSDEFQQLNTDFLDEFRLCKWLTPNPNLFIYQSQLNADLNSLRSARMQVFMKIDQMSEKLQVYDSKWLEYENGDYWDQSYLS